MCDNGMSADQWCQEYIIEHARSIELEEKLKRYVKELESAEAALDSIKECLTGLGVDMSKCSTEAYPDAIRKATTSMSSRIEKVVECAVNWHRVSGEGWGEELKALHNAVRTMLLFDTVKESIKNPLLRYVFEDEKNA